MRDPFMTLQLFEDFAAGRVSAAFAAAVRDGVSIHEARAAMDVLRDPVRREAAALLAPTMCPAAVSRRAQLDEMEQDPAGLDVLLRFLAVALDEVDAGLVAEAHIPPRRHGFETYLPPLPAYLEP